MSVQVKPEVGKNCHQEFFLDLKPYLKEKTKEIHRNAERHEFLSHLMSKKKSLSNEAYCQFLKDLELVYSTLEKCLKNCSDKNYIAPICIEEIFREGPISEDLQAFPSVKVEASPVAIQYQTHLLELAEKSPHLLIAHAYTRYLGDLNGGQYIKGAVQRKWPEIACTEYYNFEPWLQKTPEAESIRDLANMYGETLNNLNLSTHEKKEVADEALKAFEFAIELMNVVTSIPSWNVPSSV